MENTQATIEILNDLIQINNDRIAGYELALKELKEEDADIKYLFTNLVGESHQFKLELGTEVQVLGKDIDNTTSASGKIHRAWLGVKATFTGHNTKSVLEECEFGEDAIKLAYRSAIEDEALPAYIKDILYKQQEILQAAHDEVKALRDHVQ
ncbi:PA2169 family four-helix-bundle protein [Mucilaginibacter gynuensis]|uniref:PA2169 family four-helix-bundle protein n=1 Tax=Mucilaginibacter gynuensis TaxID=1302236 RepID=A0ABP8FV10_9SPHI